MANVGWTISLSFPGSSAEKKRALDEMDSRKDKRHYCREIVISSCAKVRGKPRDQTTADQLICRPRSSTKYAYLVIGFISCAKSIEVFCHMQSLSLRISRVLSFKH
jgi:hypothetical protein